MIAVQVGFDMPSSPNFRGDVMIMYQLSSRIQSASYGSNNVLKALLNSFIKLAKAECWSTLAIVVNLSISVDHFEARFSMNSFSKFLIPIGALSMIVPVVFLVRRKK
ncbi:hypothetical protein GJ496_001587 [Pomphorhynchus laevis]|nr:hypothetical protein GJ496_001587 [Pomphorhynchus laevis]